RRVDGEARERVAAKAALQAEVAVDAGRVEGGDDVLDAEADAAIRRLADEELVGAIAAEVGDVDAVVGSDRNLAALALAGAGEHDPARGTPGDTAVVGVGGDDSGGAEPEVGGA